MANFGTAVKATATAEDASGSAMKENEKAMDSLEKKTNMLIAEFQRLVWGEDGGLNTVLKMLIDLGTAVLKFANSDIGKFIIKVTALVAVMTLLTKTTKLISNAFVGIKKAFEGAITALVKYAVENNIATVAELETAGATGVLSTALKALGNVIKTHPIFALVTVIGAIASLFGLFSNSTEESTKSLTDYKNAVDETNQKLNDLRTELSGVKKQIEDIQNSGKIELTDNRQLALLEAEKQQLEDEILLQKQLLEIEKNKEKAKAKEILNQQGVMGTDFTTSSGTKLRIAETQQAQMTFVGITGSNLELFEEATSQMKSYGDMALEASNKVRELEEQNKQNTEEYIEAKKRLQDYTEAYGYYKQVATEFARYVKDASDVLGKNTEEYKIATEWLGIYRDAIIATNDALGTENATDELTTMAEVADNLGISVEDLQNALGELDWEDVLADFEAYNDGLEDGEITIEEYIRANYELESSIQSVADKFEEWNSAIDDIQGNYSKLTSIVDSYNESGGYTIDNLQDLLALSPEYLAMLSMENGQLVLNTQAIQDKIVAKTEEAKAIVYESAVEQLNQLAQEKNKKATEESAQASSDAVSSWDDETEAISRNNVAVALNNALKAGVSEEETEAVLNNMQMQLDAIDDLVNNISVDFTKSMGSSAKSTSKATDAVKDLKKELEDLKSKYEKVIAIIDKKLEDMMDKLEKEKDKVIDGIEDQINALKKLQDSEVAGYKKQIKSLQEAQQKEEDYWDEKINALKEANKQMEEQNQLMKLQEALASAQATKVKVMKDGKFQFVQDDKAVDKAKSELDKYTKEQAYEQQLRTLEKMKANAVQSYDAQIADLQKFVDNLSDNYEQQIKDLENLKDEKEKSYNDQIAQIQAYKDEFDEMVNAYQEEQDRLLVEEMTGIDIESENWETRLSNLTEFVNEYNKILAQLGTDNTDVKSGYTGTRTTDLESAKSRVGDYTSETKQSVAGSKYGNGASGGAKNDIVEQAEALKKAEEEAEKRRQRALSATKSAISAYAHASGISSIKDDEIALVGDAPNKELVIGSKLNGQLMNLSKGTGVVNADSTRTVAGLLNSLGKSSALASNTNYTTNNNSTNTTQQFSFGNISLPNVTDANSFVNELANNFKEYAVQNSHK